MKMGAGISFDSIGQQHLVDVEGVDKEAITAQLTTLDGTIPGGLKGYIERSKKLLHEVRNDINPLADYHVQFATGVDLTGPNGPGCDGFDEYERIGLEKIGKLGFVLVAGGLGERLGFPGIKVALPTEAITGINFLNLYIDYIKAVQSYVRKSNPSHFTPLCIMTSGDTHEKTIDLLKKNNYYGLEDGQIIIVQQDKVPAFSGGNSGEECLFVLSDDKKSIETKPHGHGDVHTLLHMKGVGKKFLKEFGLEYVLFFQDTNPLAFRAMCSFLGVSISKNFAMNSLAVPRKAGEAAGAIVNLVKKKDLTTSMADDSNAMAENSDLPDSLVINVEYNILGSMLADQGGDVSINDLNDSAYPGNCNVLLFELNTYVATLESTNGVVPEFVNPKFQDKEKTIFKPTRLECLMQDFPRLYKKGEKVGFTRYDRWLCFTTVKNNLQDALAKANKKQPPDCSFSCESDIYYANSRLLMLAGKPLQKNGGNWNQVVDVEISRLLSEKSFLGITKDVAPKVILMPSWAFSLRQMRELCNNKTIELSKDATLLVAGKVEFNGLKLKAGAGVELIGETQPLSLPENALVDNRGAVLEEVQDLSHASAAMKIRGYHLIKKDCPTITTQEEAKMLIGSL